VFASDSMDIDVARTAGQVTLTFTNGKNILVADRGTSLGPPKFDNATSRIRVLVYPTQVAAGADPTGSGVGAVFNGVAALSSPGGIVATSGDFTAANFTTPVDDGAGRFSAATVNGLTKSVTVANSDSAVVRAFGDPTSVNMLPASTSVTIGLLSVLLLGIGWITLYYRKRSVAV
jgi:hypothetical protein